MTAPDWTDAAIDALVAECDEFDEAAEGQPWLPRHFRDDVTGHDSETLAALANRAEEERSRLLSALRSVLAERALTESEAATMREASTSLNAMLVPRLFAIVTRLTRRTP